WFAVAYAAALPLLVAAEVPGSGLLGSGLQGSRLPGSWFGVSANLALLVALLVLVHVMARGAIWSPYYKITVKQEGSDTVVEVNNIWHQSMAPVDHKEYFYQRSEERRVGK